MIDQHFNHPSIIFWGLGNEDDWPGEYPSVDEAADSSLHDRAEHSGASARSIAVYTSYRRCGLSPAIFPMSTVPRSGLAGMVGYTRTISIRLRRRRKRVGTLSSTSSGGADSHARPSRPKILTAASLESPQEPNTAERRDLPTRNHGGIARVSRDGDWSENLCMRSLRLASEDPGGASVAFRCSSMDLQGLHHSAPRGEPSATRKPEKVSFERDLTPKEGLLRLQVLLEHGSYGASLRTHMAGTVGSSG